MNRQYERRLRRLEQKQSQTKKAWVPQWLSDSLSEGYGLPFDNEERGLDSLRRIQKGDTVVTPVDDDSVIERLYAVAFGEARRTQKRGLSPADNQAPVS